LCPGIEETLGFTHQFQNIWSTSRQQQILIISFKPTWLPRVIAHTKTCALLPEKASKLQADRDLAQQSEMKQISTLTSLHIHGRFPKLSGTCRQPIWGQHQVLPLIPEADICQI
jgi:hypothetical protein